MSQSCTVITSCFGDRFWSALGPWIDHIKALNQCAIEIVSLDGRAGDFNAATLLVDQSETTLRYGASDRFRLERILFHLEQGRTCIQIDLDVRFKRDFSRLCCLPYDFIISRAFHAPPVARERFGFVACTGFYIAKPASRRLCEAWLSNIRDNTYQSHLDQYVLNVMLCGVAGDRFPRKETVQIDELSLEMDVFEYSDCKIAVLPKQAIERNRQTELSLFGNHHRSLIDDFTASPPAIGA